MNGVLDNENELDVRGSYTINGGKALYSRRNSKTFKDEGNKFIYNSIMNGGMYLVCKVYLWGLFVKAKAKTLALNVLIDIRKLLVFKYYQM
ncbi:hypothetical protein HPP92_025976 [Vanilla planifolia]|uniref:Uncharacterized protein n=1 Tax=Vanilla planifolia TaxID=51239 RepID=A0A835PGG4_VANPL|nr:hypothetical protein HPP92_025976 [Vanilla planifolia]